MEKESEEKILYQYEREHGKISQAFGPKRPAFFNRYNARRAGTNERADPQNYPSV
jgi:hypothetical protein